MGIGTEGSLARLLATTRTANPTLTIAQLAPPWGLQIDPSIEAAIHVVQRGESYLHVQGRIVQLDEGDVLLIRQGVAHAVSDGPSSPIVPYAEALAAMPARLVGCERPSEILCAKFLIDTHGTGALTQLLPPWVRLSRRDGLDHPQLALSLELLALEAKTRPPGHALVLDRLVDQLLIFVLRLWLMKHGRSEWEHALKDPHITEALGLLHSAPDHAWTVEGLARTVGQSRAAFARSFRKHVGVSPLRYLATWRMELATSLLREGRLSQGEIAERVGYQSVAAFSRAYRRVRGQTPGSVRLAGD